MNPPFPEAITFDAAGTLFSVAEPVGTTYSEIARLHGMLLDPDSVERSFRSHFEKRPPPHAAVSGRIENLTGHEVERRWWRSLVGDVLREASGSQLPAGAAFDRLFENLFDHYAAASAWCPAPGIRASLEVLHGRFKLGVISNFDRRFHSISEGLGLSPFFDSVILSSEIGASKPDPAIFAAASRKLNTTPGKILHIGDDPLRDGQGARRAGFQFLQVVDNADPAAEILKRFGSGGV